VTLTKQRYKIRIKALPPAQKYKKLGGVSEISVCLRSNYAGK
jgi:hypothetical protein